MTDSCDVSVLPAKKTPDPLSTRNVKLFARSAWRANLVSCAIVSVLGAVLISPLISPSAIISTSYDSLLAIFRFFHLTQAETALNGLSSAVNLIRDWTSVGDSSSAGVISSVYHSIKTSGSIEKAVIYALSHAFLRQNISSSIIAGLALLATIAIRVFVRVPLEISTSRFYLETRLYPGTSPSRLLFVFRRRRVLRMAWASIYKTLWLILWALTVVMAPVKYYSYLMYDYILAENPDATPRDALKLSQAMMKGNRWRTFLIDLSFLPWYLLGLVTFGLVAYFYATPYHSLARSQVYVQLRERAKAADYPGIELCDDPYLTQRPTAVSSETALASASDAVNLPANIYPDPHALLLSGSHTDYRREYCLPNLILLFFIFSFVGWLYESVLSLAYVGRFVNRGTMYGPWIPIYGTGAVLALVVLRKFRDRPFVTFALAALIAGTLEYTSATIIYVASGLEYWSYAGYFFNIQGRVCLEGLLVFGMGCLAVIYFVAPILDTWLNRIPLVLRQRIAVALISAFVIDAGFTLAFPRVGFGITS